ncbi:MAG: DMT family transporter [Verrucomicrobia bacterium]|nr:DMT family transporter [Verrucomicrobiota bacterium]
MFTGILCIIAACFCWGLIFVIPLFLSSFSPVEIALGRYLFFGLTSLILLLGHRRHLFQKAYLGAWLNSIWFAFLSTLLSYTSIVFCIRYANSAVAALIFGMSPITIALTGNLFKKEFSFRSFIIPCLVMALGIMFTNIHAFQLDATNVSLYCIGFFCGLLGLASWTWYTIANFHYLKRRPMPTHDWIVMLGVSTLLLVFLSAGIYACLNSMNHYLHWSPELESFLLGSFILGTVSTWAAFYFWNRGNLRLPISLAGQLTVFEMIFGLLFVYLAEERWPTSLEVTGMVLMLIGVLAAFKSLRKVPSHATS